MIRPRRLRLPLRWWRLGKDRWTLAVLAVPAVLAVLEEQVLRLMVKARKLARGTARE